MTDEQAHEWAHENLDGGGLAEALAEVEVNPLPLAAGLLITLPDLADEVTLPELAELLAGWARFERADRELS